MHHDKKTLLQHQDILARRGFNIPVAEAVLKVKSEIKKVKDKPAKKVKSEIDNSKSAISNG